MDDLKLIKRHYGEKTMHLCRDLFPTILEEEGLLFQILSSKFSYYKYLAEDIIENNEIEIFKNIIISIIKNEKEKEKYKDTNKTPKELFEEIGYNFYECHSEEDIQSFRKYFAIGEELCTFNGGRLNNCHIFFAVKKNIDEIKRRDFKGKEERQDKYGTSVISIQFSKGKINTLSIKNRYNHTVDNPDATFANNLENITPGLTKSFEKNYKLNINQNIKGLDELTNYVLANDEKYYRYNFERLGIYYCTNNIIIDNYKVAQYDKSRYLVFDQYILDMQEKKLNKYNDFFGWKRKGLNEIHKTITTIKIENEKSNNIKKIYLNDDTLITLNHRNGIIEYHNSSITTTPYGFTIAEGNDLKVIDLPNVTRIDSEFHTGIDAKICDLNIPKVEEIGTNFDVHLYLEKLSLPKCKKIGKHFASSSSISKIDLSELQTVESAFLPNIRKLEKLYLPNLTEIGSDFLYRADSIKEVSLPSLKKIPDNFLKLVTTLKKIDIRNVKTIGNRFMYLDTNSLEEISMPNVTTIGNDFLMSNRVLSKIYAPKLKQIGRDFLFCNTSLEEITLESVEDLSDGFCNSNKTLTAINLPNIKEYDFGLVELFKEVEERQIKQKVYKKQF